MGSAEADLSKDPEFQHTEGETERVTPESLGETAVAPTFGNADGDDAFNAAFESAQGLKGADSGEGQLSDVYERSQGLGGADSDEDGLTDAMEGVHGLLAAGPLAVAAAAVAREALRQRGETKREELRQSGETVRVALTGRLAPKKEIEPPEKEVEPPAED